jgi:hypothetical protein
MMAILNDLDRIARLRYEAIEHELDTLRSDYRYLRSLHDSATEENRRVVSQLYALVETLQDSTNCPPPVPQHPAYDRHILLPSSGLYVFACVNIGTEHL